MTWLFLSLVLTILLTPGPTNTLLASSGIQVGFRKSLSLIPAEAIGYCLSISLWGLFIGHVSQTMPVLPAVLKLISAIYIAYLAIKLWLTARHQSLDSSLIRPKILFIATLLNPKALLFASAIFPVAVWSSFGLYLQHIGMFLVLLIPIAMLWVYLGNVLMSRQTSWLNQCNLQRFASVVLFAFTVPLSYSALNSF